MSDRILELFGQFTGGKNQPDWRGVVKQQHCPYLDKTCIKVRKSDPGTSIGTCTVAYGRENRSIVICPHRFLERKQVFTDCLHLLTSHAPGNELHVVPERKIPGGSVDYFLVSTKDRKVEDFVGIELQTLDSTGTIWPERQRFLKTHGLKVKRTDAESTKSYGMNWKMTAKTTLVQLHHKIETFEQINKHLVLVMQDCLIQYMQENFSFDHLHNPARLGDSMHFHSYAVQPSGKRLKISLIDRLSTDMSGIETCLGLQVTARVELQEIVALLEKHICDETLLTL